MMAARRFMIYLLRASQNGSARSGGNGTQAIKSSDESVMASIRRCRATGVDARREETGMPASMRHDVASSQARICRSAPRVIYA